MPQKQTRQGGRPVDLRDRVEMTSTDAHPFHKKAGVQFKIHREQAWKLVDNKWAVEGHVAADHASLVTDGATQLAKAKVS